MTIHLRSRSALPSFFLAVSAMSIAIQPVPVLAADRDSLPAVFEGSWATDYALCHSPDAPSANWTIDGNSIWSFEGGAEVTRVVPLGDSGRSYSLAVTMSGGGDEWSARLRMTIAEDGASLAIGDPSDTAGMPSQLWRCANPVPAPFLGEWAANPATDCGRPYASIHLTAGGFVMPEVGERVVMLQPMPQWPRELLMEASVSIAGTRYRERRVLRLSDDLQTLDLLSLGQIETGSEDPDWRPDPAARFQEPSRPERIERLQRCVSPAD